MGKKNDKQALDAKLEARLPTGWMDGARSMSEDELKKTLVDCEVSIQATEKDRDADAKLEAAKSDVKLLASAYKEVLEVDKAKIKAVLSILSDQGKI